MGNEGPRGRGGAAPRGRSRTDLWARRAPAWCSASEKGGEGVHRVRSRAAASFLILCVCLSAQGSGAAETSDHLRRTGLYYFEQGAFADATQALSAACPAVPGDVQCWSRLAVAAEAVRRIDVAAEAWNHLAVLPGPDAEGARAEVRRLNEVWGRLEVVAGAGRSWPSRPLVLQRLDLLLDPALKAHAAALVQRVSERGMDEPSLWLPSGAWALDGRRIEVPRGGVATIEAGRSWLPYAAPTFARRDAPPPTDQGGPAILGFGGQFALGGSLAPEAPSGPVRTAVVVELGGDVGPTAWLAGVELGVAAVGSLSDPAERRRPGVELLGTLGLGPLLQVSPRALLRPYAAAVFGSFGDTLVGCVVEAGPGGAVSHGQCRLARLGIGGRAGLDVFVWPTRSGRLSLRLGPYAEGAALFVLTGPGTAVGEAGTLVRAASWRQTVLRGGLRVGVDLRF